MALTVAASNTCEQINIIADYYSASTSANLTFSALNASGQSILNITNELIDCACDCAKCSSVLAKAQKIMLLLKSAEYSLKQSNVVGTTLKAGYITDANNKYTKAREVCDNSCGCDC